MFDYALKAEIKRVEVLVPKVDGPVTKVCRITFRRDLDVDIARSLAGEFGVAALKHLHDRGITKIEFPIDAITARAVISDGGLGDDRIHLAIPVVTGMKAIAKVKVLKEDKDADCPQVELKFQFPYTTEAWEFCGDNACTTIEVRLTRNQLSLNLTGAPADEAPPTKANGKKSRKKSGTLTTKSSHGDDNAEVAGEIADPQDAATPEEAEELRAQRMREERGRDDGVWDEAH